MINLGCLLKTLWTGAARAEIVGHGRLEGLGAIRFPWDRCRVLTRITMTEPADLAIISNGVSSVQGTDDGTGYLLRNFLEFRRP